MESLYPENKEKPYLEQWDRTTRWYKKLMLVKYGYYRELNHKELLDIVYAFFLNINHLKDWVIYFDEPCLSNPVYQMLSREHFRMISELANGHKHFKRDARAKDPESAIKHQNVKVSIGSLLVSTTHSGMIENEALGLLRDKCAKGPEYSWDFVYSGKKYDCYDVAQKGYEDWAVFLKQRDLL